MTVGRLPQSAPQRPGMQLRVRPVNALAHCHEAALYDDVSPARWRRSRHSESENGQPKSSRAIVMGSGTIGPVSNVGTTGFPALS